MRMRQLACGGLACLLASWLLGCVSQEELDQEFRARRQRSYEALARTSAAEGRSDVLDLATGPLSVAQCIDLALLHNKDVQVARAALAEAEGRMTEAIATALPEASASASAFAVRSDALGSTEDTYDVGLQGRQPLYLGGLTRAAVDAAAAFQYLSEQQLRQRIQRVHQRVRQFYLDALLQQALTVVAEKAREDARENLADVQKKQRYGVGTRFEVLRAEVRVTAAEADLINRRNEARIAKATLLNEMGVSQLSEIELTDTLTFSTTEVSREQCLQEAMRQRPELLIGEANVRLGQDQVLAEQATNRPKLYLQADYLAQNPGFGSFLGRRDWDSTLRGGLVLEWPFFDGFRTDGRVSQARAQLEQQKALLRKQEQQVQLDVTQTFLTLQSSREFVLSQQGNVANAEEALRLARVIYREGTGTSLDVLQAELSLSQARSDYVRAVHQHAVAGLLLEAAVGIIGEAPLPGATVEGMTEPAPAETPGAAPSNQASVNQ